MAPSRGYAKVIKRTMLGKKAEFEKWRKFYIKKPNYFKIRKEKNGV